ncbi:MAG: hypothetical protein N3A57_06290 [Negativicutes bacterium]|nr:hypothetical protein [Negativicutes bacterium]
MNFWKKLFASREMENDGTVTSVTETAETAAGQDDSRLEAGDRQTDQRLIAAIAAAAAACYGDQADEPEIVAAVMAVIHSINGPGQTGYAMPPDVSGSVWAVWGRTRLMNERLKMYYR